MSGNDISRCFVKHYFNRGSMLYKCYLNGLVHDKQPLFKQVTLLSMSKRYKSEKYWKS